MPELTHPVPFPPERRARGFIYHCFGCYFTQREGRILRTHHLRDVPALLELGSALTKRGGEYGRLVLNRPPPREEQDHLSTKMMALAETGTLPRVEETVRYRQVDHSILRPGETL